MNTRFRNVEFDRNAPIGTWPLEALSSLLERGDLSDYRLVVQAIQQSPWGAASRRVEQVLGWTQPYGVTQIMHRAIEKARSSHNAQEREWVTYQLRNALQQSGLNQAAFAQELGTSPTRFSTYLNGSVVPAATVIARAQSIAQRADL